MRDSPFAVGGTLTDSILRAANMNGRHVTCNLLISFNYHRNPLLVNVKNEGG